MAADIQVSMFITCLADSFFPDVGISMVRVLRALNVDVNFPPGQTCCGQVTFNSGYWEDTRGAAKQFIRTFEDSEYIVMPSGSCAGMVRKHYTSLLADEPDWVERAQKTAKKVYEFSEFLVKVVGVENIHGTLQATATYHSSCHMTRELGVTDEPLQVLGQIEGLTLRPLANATDCCGFGGTFAVKEPEVSAAMADEKLEHMLETTADFVIASDMGCVLHLAGRAQRQGRQITFKHVAQVLAEGGLG